MFLTLEHFGGVIWHSLTFLQILFSELRNLEQRHSLNLWSNKRVMLGEIHRNYSKPREHTIFWHRQGSKLHLLRGFAAGRQSSSRAAKYSKMMLQWFCFYPSNKLLEESDIFLPVFHLLLSDLPELRKSQQQFETVKPRSRRKRVMLGEIQMMLYWASRAHDLLNQTRPLH